MSIRKDVRQLLAGSDYYDIEITPEQFGLDSVEALRQALRETKDTGCVHLDCSKAGREPDVTLCRCGNCGATLGMIQYDAALPPGNPRQFFGLNRFRAVTAWTHNYVRRKLYAILYFTRYEGEHFQSTSKTQVADASLRRGARAFAKAGLEEDWGMGARRIEGARTKQHIFTSLIGRLQDSNPHLEFEAPIVEIKCPHCRWINYQDLAELA